MSAQAPEGDAALSRSTRPSRDRSWTCPTSRGRSTTCSRRVEGVAAVSPAAVGAWLDRFDDDFVGLIGGNARTQQVLVACTRRGRNAMSTLASDPSHGHEALEHSGVVHLVGLGDSAGVVHSGGMTVDQYADDISRSPAG